MAYITNPDFLRAAFEAEDAVSLCVMVSRDHGHELTLGQAGHLMDRITGLCESCLGNDWDEDGYCVPCEEPA